MRCARRSRRVAHLTPSSSRRGGKTRGAKRSLRFEDRAQLDRLADSKDHQGIVALVAARAAGTLDEILASANAGAGRGEKGLIVLLDGVEDPHHLGAVIRPAL